MNINTRVWLWRDDTPLLKSKSRLKLGGRSPQGRIDLGILNRWGAKDFVRAAAAHLSSAKCEVPYDRIPYGPLKLYGLKCALPFFSKNVVCWSVHWSSVRGCPFGAPFCHLFADVWRFCNVPAVLAAILGADIKKIKKCALSPAIWALLLSNLIQNGIQETHSRSQFRGGGHLLRPRQDPPLLTGYRSLRHWSFFPNSYFNLFFDFVGAMISVITS